MYWLLLEKRKAMTEKNYNNEAIEMIEKNKTNLGLFAKYVFGDKESHISSCKKHYPTGFPALDESLGGGFTSGLHCLGAISSLGKSTFVQQIAENMSASGIPVLLFSLEMGMLHIAAKAVSRWTYIDSHNNKEFEYTEKTVEELLNKEYFTGYTEDDWEAVSVAAEIAAVKNMNLQVLEQRQENRQSWTADSIADYVVEWVGRTGQHPFVIIDYLQLLQMPDGASGWTDKQIVDYNLQRLFSLAESSDVPILLISSFNRAAYNSKASLASFKDSGSIEYSCDTVIAMDLCGVGEKDFDEAAEKAQVPRGILVRILKQRYGKAGDELPFLYDARYNFFEDPSAFPEEEEDENVLYFP